MSVAGEYRTLAARFQTLPERIVRAGAADMQASIVERLRLDTGGDQVVGRAPRGRRRRSKLSASVRITPGRHVASATITPSPKRGGAPWSWLEFGTAAHDVGVRRDGNGGLHMRIGGNWHTGPWHVRGAPPKHTFTEGSTRGARLAEESMIHVWESELR